MADSDVIQYGDLIDPQAIPKLVDQVNELSSALAGAEASMIKVMAASKGGLTHDLATTQDVQLLQQTIQKINDLALATSKTKQIRKELTVATAEAKLQQQQLNAGIKEAAKNNLGLTSEYQKQSMILNELRNKWKDLAIAGNANTESAKALQQEIAFLDTKIKLVDATVGQHQRNVGNYTGKVLELSRGLGGVTGLLGIFGKAIGLDEEAIRSLELAHHSLTAGARDLHHAIGLNNEAAGENTAITETQIDAIESETIATESQTAVVEDAAVAQDALNTSMLANPVVLIIAGVAALVAILGSLSKATYQSKEMNDDFSKSIEEISKDIDKNLESIQKLGIEYNVLTGNISKFDGQRLENAAETNRRIAESNKKFKEDNDKLVEDSQESQKGFFSELLNDMGGVTQKQLDIQAQQVSRQKSLAADHAADLLSIQTEASQKSLNITAAQKAEIDAENAKTAAEKTSENDKYAKAYEEYLKEMAKFREDMLKLEHEQEHEKILSDKEAADKAAADQQKADDKTDEMRVNANIKWIKDSEETQKRKEEFEAKEAEKAKKLQEEQTKAALATADKLFKIEEDHQKKMAEIKLQGINYDLENTRSAVEMQTALAAAGKENTLAAELNKQDELEKARQQELDRQKKVAKEQEAAKLSLLFIEALEKQLDAGKSFSAALGLAVTEVAGAKIIGSAIAGDFAEGVENFKGRGTGTSDSNLIGFSNGESVVTEKGTKETQGLVTAINKDGYEGVVDWAFQNIYKPSYESGLIIADQSLKSQTDSAVMAVFINEIQELKSIIKNKREDTTHLDNLGNVVKTSVESGYRKMTTIKTHLS